MAESKVTERPVQAPPAKDNGMISVTYNPGPGDPEETEVFGKKVTAGEPFDVPAKHADKVRGNPYLLMKGEKAPEHKAEEPEEQEPASFEDNVVRERTEEYLQGRTAFATAPPGEAERVARAQEQAAEMRAAHESDDVDKPKRGRPKGS